MFPICDPMGRDKVSGRVMNRADRGAKYVNSPRHSFLKVAGSFCF